MKQFSTEDLVAYLYGEVPETKQLELEEALTQHWALQEKLMVLRESVHQLQGAWQHPRPQVTARLLQYAACQPETIA
jgi:anti-sigma factor RsiW